MQTTVLPGTRGVLCSEKMVSTSDMHVSSNFEGGNIRPIDCSEADNIRLEIRRDRESGFLQWFYFRLTGVAHRQCLLRIVNAGECSYPDGWKGYRAVASYDREFWFRVDTSYEDGELCIRHQPGYDSVHYAYFAPYSLEKLAGLVAVAQTSPRAAVLHAGTTVQERDLDVIRIGNAETNRKICWAIARQHPGETMASWWMEGFISRLLDSNDAVSRELLNRVTFYVVPNMNPDGSSLGHLRTNAAGANLNRCWHEPDEGKSPEVLHVRRMMEDTGVDLGIDVHGDEILACNFIASAEGVPSWDGRRQRLLDTYKRELSVINPDFQTEYGYPSTPPGKANLSYFSNYIAETFGALTMTHEMPFKDTQGTPNALQGWSPERSRHLGATNVEAIYRIVDEL